MSEKPRRSRATRAANPDYAAVQRTAEVLGARLRRAGVRRGRRVAIMVDDPIDAASAILGILSAGARPVLPADDGHDRCTAFVTDRGGGQRCPASARTIVRLDEDETNDEPLVSIVELRAQGDRPRVLFVVPTTTDLECLTALADRLGPDQPVAAVTVESLLTVDGAGPGVVELAVPLADAIRYADRDEPVMLAGLGDACALAYETALQLEAAGAAVAWLAVIDGWLPRSAHAAFRFSSATLARAAASLAWHLRDGVLRTPRACAGRAIRAVTHPLVRIGTGSAARNRQLDLAALRLHRALGRYEPPPVSIVLDVVRPRAHAMGSGHLDDLGWAAASGADVRVHRVPATRGRLLAPSAIAATAVAVRRSLHAAWPPPAEQAMDLESMAFDPAA